MDKDGIVEYVMSTPGNTNEQVLRMALDNLGGGDVDFSAIRGKSIEMTIDSIGRLSSVEVSGTSVAPADFVKTPFIDIILSLSDVVIHGLTVKNTQANDVLFETGSAQLDSRGNIWLQGIYTYTTSNGTGLASGGLFIPPDLRTEFNSGTVFVSPQS